MREQRLGLEVIDALGDRASEWDRLVSLQPLPSPFLRPWWLGSAASGSPRLLLCIHGDELVGGAAFETDVIGVRRPGIERVRCLGQGPLAPDHLDVIAAPGRESEVAELVLRWLHRPGNRIVDLDGLATDGVLARSLGGHELSRTPAPFAVLPTDLDTYMSHRPGRLRSTVGRTRARVAKTGATIRHVHAADAERALADLARLHEHRWGDESAFLRAWDRIHRAATSGMRDGAVLIHEAVDADGTVVATELDLVSGRSLAFYQAGRRTDREWNGIGSVLRAEVIGWAIDQGFTEYDMLRGDEDYKADWAGSRRDVVRVRFGTGPIGRVVAAGAATWSATRRRRVRPPTAR